MFSSRIVFVYVAWYAQNFSLGVGSMEKSNNKYTLKVKIVWNW